MVLILFLYFLSLLKFSLCSCIALLTSMNIFATDILNLWGKSHSPFHLNRRFILFIWQYWGLNFGPHTCEASTVSLKPLLQSFCLVIFQISSHAFFPELALNYNSPISTSCIAGITGTYHPPYAAYLLR
jgi:hypothetical protein